MMLPPPNPPFERAEFGLPRDLRDEPPAGSPEELAGALPVDPAELPDDDLTRKIHVAVAGDVDALEALLERFGAIAGRRIDAEIGGQWRGALDADDIMQVTYLEAFLQIGSLAGTTRRTFMGWLMRIARNNLRDAIRGLESAKRPQPRRRVALPSSDDSYAALAELISQPGATPSRCAARSEARTRLEAALDRLPSDYANVLRLHDLQGRTMADTAHRMDRSRGVLYALRARALERLRDLLGSGSRYFSHDG